MGTWLSGRASALHAEGPGFDPRRLQFWSFARNAKDLVLLRGDNIILDIVYFWQDNKDRQL